MKLKYRCRMCGAEFGNLHGRIETIKETLNALTYNDHHSAGFVICIRDVHYCDGNNPINRIGIADLIGAEEETK